MAVAQYFVRYRDELGKSQSEKCTSLKQANKRKLALQTSGIARSPIRIKVLGVDGIWRDVPEGAY